MTTVAVARPSTTAEVAEVLRDAAARGHTVVPTGRGTKLSWGMPVEPDVLVDLSGMDRVVDHQAGDLIVVAEAGARLADVQALVGGARQRLALDETVPGASIGGTIATNASGPQRLLAGTARDLLIGVTVVRADGVVAKAGGRVVKNVAGYDVGKLMVGSFGTLAVVTEAVFRLHPEPEARRWVSVEPDDLPDAVRAVVHSQAAPWAVEVDGGTLSVLLGGRTDGVDARARTIADLVGGDVSSTAPPWWGTCPWAEGETGLKITFLLSGLRDVLAAAADVGARVRGSAGSGVVHAAVADGVPDALARLREAAARHDGTVVVVDAPPEVKAAVDVWGPVPALDLMRRVKREFDPDHRLSPGRFVGGI
ncbi:FAD-binding protein [Nocardioides sp. MAH-18]|uniref:FAD-binding protein n=1 Tax=Nocardioides agri TaxID=2682843 RepID=A0A6L6XVN7_9ACTN|nr:MULTISPECIES: FAD-binding oxidoreductase [unclassified Nocardioides]MBA2955686.1 FAD-binding oxidoreductase [Nocardioides sp. CGMCC 1.13656]MVQ50536.1 FAD-binding protein [Nocardioides sp. MAH-18]